MDDFFDSAVGGADGRARVARDRFAVPAKGGDAAAAESAAAYEEGERGE